VRIAKVLRRQRKESLQDVFSVFVQPSVGTSSSVVLQRAGVAGVCVGFDPVVNRLPSHAQHPSNVGDRSAIVKLQDSQRAPKQANIPGSRELLPEAVPLPRSQVEQAHALLLHR
jgi:hypothetical protein